MSIGKIRYKILYDTSAERFNVTLKHVKNVYDLARVHVSLQPGSYNELEITVVDKSLKNPINFFMIPLKEAKTKTLVFRLFDSFQKGFGEVQVPLSNIDLTKEIDLWKELDTINSNGNKKVNRPVTPKVSKKEEEENKRQAEAEIKKGKEDPIYRRGTLSTEPEPYIILVGDVGSGKSSLVERVAGAEGRSSAAKESFTRTSEVFTIPGKLKICDTPGSNAMEDNLLHNVWIAQAFNHQPVTKLFIVVKATSRIDNVLYDVAKYFDNFVDIPEETFGVCVTHMDTVQWTKDDFLPKLKDRTNISSVVFSKPSMGGHTLLTELIGQCGSKPTHINIDKDNFEKMLPQKDINIIITKTIKKEVATFRNIVEQWKKERERFPSEDQVCLVFEFHAFMKHEISEAQKRVARKYDFTFEEGSKEISAELGHLNQLTSELQRKFKDVEVSMNRYNFQSQSRSCPYCSKFVLKDFDFDGFVTCGDYSTITEPISRLSVDWREEIKTRETFFGTFSFIWDDKQFMINKREKNTLLPKQFGNGCGRTVPWHLMTPHLSKPKCGNDECKISVFSKKEDFDKIVRDIKVQENVVTSPKRNNTPKAGILEDEDTKNRKETEQGTQKNTLRKSMNNTLRRSKRGHEEKHSSTQINREESRCSLM